MTTACCCLMSRSASRAKVGQSEAPSAITQRTGRPSRPPSRLICSSASTSASIIDRSLTAIGPVCEWRMPTTIGRRSTSRRSRSSQPAPARAASEATASQAGQRRRPGGGPASRRGLPAVERGGWFMNLRADGPGDGGTPATCNLWSFFLTGRSAGKKPGIFRLSRGHGGRRRSPRPAGRLPFHHRRYVRNPPRGRFFWFSRYFHGLVPRGPRRQDTQIPHLLFLLVMMLAGTRLLR